ncbi:MAG: nickel pincer cofactor biosynthesis protein LarC [bacterium]
MRIAVIDCVGGASGDMFLGALLAAGVPRDAFDAAIASLGLPGVRVEAERTSRHGIGGIAARVVGGGDAHRAHTHEPHEHAHHDHEHAHGHHDHSHTHSHDDAPRDAHSHTHDETHRDQHSHHEPHRGLREIEAIIAHSGLSPRAKEKSIETFRAIAVVEGEIHGMPPEQVHFHEVGAVDAIVDVVGTVVGFELLGIERAFHSAVPQGQGEVRAAHGVIPLPAPATLALLRGRPVRMTANRYEMTTPTGAALLVSLASPDAPPVFRPLAIGYGCGSRDPKEIANVLRIVVAETDDALHEETLFLIETNVDDMNPQAVEPLFERVFAAGARDFFVTPIQMKKGRPALLLSALVDAERVGAVSRTLLVDTPTLGVRVRETRRLSLPREERTIDTEWGSVRVKIPFLDGRPLRARPEYEDCRRIARERGLPFLEVYESVMRRLA